MSHAASGSQAECLPITPSHLRRSQVAYPIIDIREAKLGARAFVEALENTVIDTLGRVII